MSMTINIGLMFTQQEDIIYDLDRTRINHSVFARLDKKNNLEIIRQEGEKLEPKLSFDFCKKFGTIDLRI